MSERSSVRPLFPQTSLSDLGDPADKVIHVVEELRDNIISACVDLRFKVLNLIIFCSFIVSVAIRVAYGAVQKQTEAEKTAK